MTARARDVLRIYVVWHPEFSAGPVYARAIQAHFDALGMNRDGITLSVPVRIRSASYDGTRGGPPRPIDFDLAEHNIVVVLGDRRLTRASSRLWQRWLDDLDRRDGDESDGCVAYLVPMGNLGGMQQLQRRQRDPFDGRARAPTQPVLERLLIRLTHFAASRVWKEPADGRLKVFVSYARGGPESGGGTDVAQAIHGYLSLSRLGLEPFLDVRDTPEGAHYMDLFERTIEQGIVLVVYSERWGTRSFCRRELLWAKRSQRPVMVALRLNGSDERMFPYLGNVPVRVLRYERGGLFRDRPGEPGPGSRLRDDTLRGLVMDLLSESLRCAVWTATALSVAQRQPSLPQPILTLPRPIELADIALLRAKGQERGTILYPDPPIDAAEMMLVEAVSDGFHVATVAQLGA